jgi:hypothetical protein
LVKSRWRALAISSIWQNTLKMRLSEKTIELNFCAQLTRIVEFSVLWFGLTQRQEAEAGFDTCTRLGGRLLLFQFKASNTTLRSGKRRFVLQHDQLMNLIYRVKGFQRSVFYVFPLVGNTLELSRNANVVGQSWLLDVARLPAIDSPTTGKGTPRRTHCHYADVAPGIVTLHSKPMEFQLISAITLLERGFSGADGIMMAFRNFADFWEFRQNLLPNSAGAVIIHNRIEPNTA